MAKVVIFGCSDIADVVYFYLARDSEHEIVAFTVDGDYLTADTFQGLPMVPYENLESYYPPDRYQLFIAISYIKVNQLRKSKYLDAKARGYKFISYVSSKALYHDTPIGENTFIAEGNLIQPFVLIGNNCILLGPNYVGHHTTIADHCFLTADVSIGGSSTIGEASFIGLNATIRNWVSIGKENIIGAGSIILSNTEDRAVYAPGETPKFAVPSNLIRI
jgi:sugar O-acyltransferase (sialic acid O-acetyltransferase NeuD family)